LTLPKRNPIFRDPDPKLALSEEQKRCLSELQVELEKPLIQLKDIYTSYRRCQTNHTIYMNSLEAVVAALDLLGSLITPIENVTDVIEKHILHLIDVSGPSNVE
jgi:hypothetical protein